MSWSRETVACEQETCPPEAGRTYTLECKCPEGTTEEYDELTDPTTGSPYSLVAACAVPANPEPSGDAISDSNGEIDCKSASGACGESVNGEASGETAGETGSETTGDEAGDTGNVGSSESTSSSWWSRQSRGVKVAIVAGGVSILVGGAILAGLVTWAGVSAIAGAAAASLGSVTPFAAEFVTAWTTRKAMKVFAQRFAKQAGKYLAKRLGHRATEAELRQFMLQLINKELTKRGLGQWSMTQLETFLKGIDLFW